MTDMESAPSIDETGDRFRREEAERLGRDLGERSYRVTDPANRYVRCGCGRTDCWTSGLLPLRAHISALYQAILALGYAERFLGMERHYEAWPGVTYALQMAGGVSDLVCDPSYVCDDESAFYCEGVAVREDEDRELASKYAAALIMFNFVWSAYEAAIEISSNGESVKDKLPVHARRLMQREAGRASQIRGLNENFMYARRHCAHHEPLKSEIAAAEAKHGLTGAAAAADLVRMFRNYIVHGKDPVPPQSVGSCYRFYAVTRVVLLLTQHLILRRVRAPSQPVRLSVIRDEIGREPAGLLMCNLHYDDRTWRTMMRKTGRYRMRTTRSFAGL